MNFGKFLTTAMIVFNVGMSATALADTSASGSTPKKSNAMSVKKSARKSLHKKSSSAKSAGLKARTETASLQTSNGKGPQPSAGKSKLGTDFDFQGLAVGGKYNSADGILTTVEGDKNLENLLNPRPNFKDRLAQAAESQ